MRELVVPSHSELHVVVPSPPGIFQVFFLSTSIRGCSLHIFHASVLNTLFSLQSLRGLYGDAAQEMDASVGVVMQKLKDLGLEDNTLVIFTRYYTAKSINDLISRGTSLIRDIWHCIISYSVNLLLQKIF